LATDNKDFRVKNGLVVGAGGTFEGTVVVATPTENTHAATKQYVDENAGGGSVTVSDEAPTSPTPSTGDMWYDSTDGGTYIYYDGFWIETSTGAESATLNVNSPLSYSQETGILDVDLTFHEDHKVMSIMGAY
jgi:DNA-binding beta-propeller fold protein YncE